MLLLGTVDVAVMVAWPTATAVTVPFEETLATAGLLLAQVTPDWVVAGGS
jgi:hypothetical protein